MSIFVHSESTYTEVLVTNDCGIGYNKKNIKQILVLLLHGETLFARTVKI